MKITIGSTTFTAALYDNPSADVLKAKLPFAITMTELNANEKYYYFPGTFPQNATVPGTIREGDLMLYENNCLVLFYKTINTSFPYTKIGHIDNTVGLKDALGKGNVMVKFEE